MASAEFHTHHISRQRCSYFLEHLCYKYFKTFFTLDTADILNVPTTNVTCSLRNRNVNATMSYGTDESGKNGRVRYLSYNEKIFFQKLVIMIECYVHSFK